jgi:hypothetical protein
MTSNVVFVDAPLAAALGAPITRPDPETGSRGSRSRRTSARAS